jgi:hypothetical protein
MRLAIAQVGEPLELVEILRVFSGRIVQLEDGKLWIKKFIEFQYGILSPDCKPHLSVIKRLDSLGLSKGYAKGIHTLQEKEKDKEKEKEGVKGKPKMEELVEFFQNQEMASDFMDYYESNGWRVGRNPMKNWESAARRWKRQNGQKPSNTGKRHMSAFEIEKRKTAISEEINKIFRRNGGKRIEGDGIDDLKQRRDELQKSLTI